MGRVFNIKRNNGLTWYIEYYYNGKQQRELVGKSRDGITASHAKEALKSRMGDIAKGKFDIAHTKQYPTFNRLLDKYLDWSANHKRSYSRDIVSSKHLSRFLVIRG